MAEDLAATSSPGSRLYEKAKLRQARKVLLSRLLPEECTFSPQTNPAKFDQNATGDAYERLHSHANSLREKQQALADKVVQAEGCTFSPTITKKAQRLLEADRKHREEQGINAGEALYKAVSTRSSHRVASRACIIIQIIVFLCVSSSSFELKELTHTHPSSPHSQSLPPLGRVWKSALQPRKKIRYLLLRVAHLVLR